MKRERDQLRRQLDAVDANLPTWESAQGESAVGRVQTIINLKADREERDQARDALRKWQATFPAHRAECAFLTERGCTCGLDEAHRLTSAALSAHEEVWTHEDRMVLGEGGC
jgi:hypothetical protein